MTLDTQQSLDSQETNLTVYYDGACPLCKREISWYRQQRGANNIKWQDVSQSTSDKVAPDLSTCDALERFHIRNADGEVISGALAFAELWLKLPKFKLLGVLVKLPMVSHVAEVAYRLFLKIRPAIQRRFRHS